MLSAEVRRLADWQRDGELAGNFAAVPALLAGMPDTDIALAGHLLSRVDPDEVDARAVTVAITGHGTVAGLVAPLTGEFARHGLLPRPVVGGFDSYVSDLGDPDGELRRCGAELTLCLLDPMVVFDELPSPWTAAHVWEALTRKLDLVERLAAGFADGGSGTLVLNTLPLPRTFAVQLLDRRSRAELGALWREGNARLLRLVADHDAVEVVDLDPLLADGVPAVDERMARYAKVNLSPALLARYAREVGHLARRATGKTRKCLVLDLDDTLWGGVLSEDGPEGIAVGGSRHGEAFVAFQHVVRQIGAQGVLLAVASKNDEGPVLDVLRRHPDMALREADFVRIAASWDPKHQVLRKLADALGIGLDSLVFVDDNATECGLVGQELPEVAVVRVTAEPALHCAALLRDDWFGLDAVTDADTARTALYRDESRRADFREHFDVVEDYLAELGVRIRVGAVRDREVDRVSQITLRTNQFNLTTTRLRPDEVRALSTAPGSSVVVIDSADRFGDNGLVGAFFLRRRGDRVDIDNFLLSCRVFARGIEQAGLATVLRQARDSGATAVFGHYEPTAKNGRFRHFYRDNGFVAVSDGVFRHDLADIAPPPHHVLVTTDPGGTG